MQERLLVVYYGIDRLPYKDENREVHYPIVNSQSGGTLITGENNTSKLYFYVGRIGGGARQWIANIKKPDGTLAYQMCENGQSVELENGEDDYRVELDISGIFADQIGDVFIGLQGYSGDTVIVENDGTYEISGDPIVLATGTIKIKVNYSPSVLAKGETITPTTEQQVMAALGAKLDKLNGIFVVANIQSESFDFSAFESGQTFLDIASRQFYRLEENAIIRLPYELNYATVNGTLLTEILASKANDSDVVHIIGNETIGGNKVFTGIIYKNSISEDNIIATIKDVEDIVEEYVGGIIYRFKGSVPTYDDLPTSGLQAGDVYNVEDSGINYAWTGTAWDALGGVGDLSNYYTKAETYSKAEVNSLLGGKLDKSSSIDKVYGTAHDGTQTTLSVDYGSTFSGNVVRRDSNSQVYVPLTPTANGQAASKKYVDDQDTAVMEVAEGKCKTFVLSYNQVVASIKGDISTSSGGNKAYEVNSSDKYDEWEKVDITADVISGEYDSIVILNSAFNSQDNRITLRATQEEQTQYLIVHVDNGDYYFVKFVYQVKSQFAKIGDIFWVIEVDVPDRWVNETSTNYMSFLQMETTKVDLTNVVTTNTDQTITGVKTFGTSIKMDANSSAGSAYRFYTNNGTFNLAKIEDVYAYVYLTIDSSGQFVYSTNIKTSNIFPSNNNTSDLGSSSYKFKDLYLSGNVDFGNGAKISKDSSNRINILYNDSIKIKVGNTETYFANHVEADTNNAYDLGRSGIKWRDLYLSGSIKGMTTLTQAQYDALVSGGTVDSDTFYFIEE